MIGNQFRSPLTEFVEHLDGIVGDGRGAALQRRDQFGDCRLVGVGSEPFGQFDVGLLVIAAERGSELVEDAAHAPTATSSAKVTMSSSEDWRSAALSSSWVIRQSVIVQMAMALASKRAQSV